MSAQQPSSAIVTITDQLELKLIHIINDYNTKKQNDSKTKISSTFITDCETHIANADATSLIKTILSDSAAIETLFTMEPMEDCISSFSIFCTLFEKIASSKDAVALSNELSKVILSEMSSSNYIPRGIMLLCTLYNLRPQGDEKCSVLNSLISLLSTQTKYAIMLLGQSNGLFLNDVVKLDQLSNMLTEWNVSVEQKRTLLQSMVKAMSVIVADKDEVQEDLVTDATIMRQSFLLLELETYSKDINETALEAAKQAAIGAILDPITLFSEQRGMLQFPAIQALQNKPDTKPLYELFVIFQTGILSTYLDFMNKNESSLTKFNLSPVDCLRFMRLLSFVTLCSTQQEIPYTTISKELQISMEDVESWVISAVSYNLITAKMDQLKQVVLVEKYLVRDNFATTKEWKDVLKKLEEWKSSIKYVMEGLKTCAENGNKVV